MRRRSPKSLSPLMRGMSTSVQVGRNPGGGGEQPVVLVPQPDQLDAERQAVGAGAGRQGNTGRAGRGPDRVEARIAGELDAGRRLAGGAGAEQDVDPVEQRIDMGAKG